LRLPILTFALSFAIFGAPQDDVVFRSGVSLVRVDIEAQDSAGNILTGLTKEDFRVLDEGAEQTTVNFSFEREPLDLILLFDTSRSMASKLHQILRAVELGFHELQTGDRVCVMTFGSFTTEAAPFTADMDKVNQTILLKVLSPGFAGAARPELAASDAAQRFRREPVTGRRRAILMIGEKPGARTGADAAIHDLWQSNAVLSQLIPDKPGRNRTLPRGENPTADQTGGATIVAGDPGPAFQDSLRRLRRRYTLYYQMPAAAPGTERHIEVTLSAEAAKRFPGTGVRARTGYIVPSR
jgi:von Willebrand factor type A domain